MAKKFKGGEVVKLNSGGPLMTIGRAIGDGSSYACYWFLQGERKEALFEEEALTQHVAEEPSVY
ncbi:YodC family protein [Lelliottia wanjuensis]|uniref:YodC family protein n=1 Tax=Lelliottia wanjuensis TaxID=3050585 RepID=UPI00254A56FE|nr:DUF2158 domain-containing protein [Lelliottia sp. V104_15]MDK9604620.1 DUF2158 domain-containing protein [Lelliottia sp. V104_15]